MIMLFLITFAPEEKPLAACNRTTRIFAAAEHDLEARPGHLPPLHRSQRLSLCLSLQLASLARGFCACGKVLKSYFGILNGITSWENMCTACIRVRTNY